MVDHFQYVLNKIVMLEQLNSQLNGLRSRGGELKVVFTNGCFDLIHRGHVDYLCRSRNLGDLLVVGLNSDDSVRRLKGASRPISSQQSRSLVLAALECVDYVVIFDDDTPINLIQAVKPDVLVKGGDYSRESIVGADFVESLGGKIVTIPFVDGESTTNLIRKIQSTQ